MMLYCLPGTRLLKKGPWLGKSEGSITIGLSTGPGWLCLL